MLRKFLLLMILITVSGWVYYEQYHMPQPARQAAGQSNNQLHLVPIIPQDRGIKNFVDLGTLSAFPKKYPRPKSQWLENEKARYQMLLLREKFDTMVIPFQVYLNGFDRPTRSLMTAELTYAIADKTDYKLPDPYLLARALGEGERKYQLNEIQELAEKMGVKRIIMAFVGHDNKQKLQVVVQELSINQLNDSAVKNNTAESKLIVSTINDDTPPVEVFRQVLPKILVELNIKGDFSKARHAKSRVRSEIKLPENPMEIFTRSSNKPIQNAYYFQLLAYLTPLYAERTRERFIEKSLLAINQISASASEYRALKARAYMLLGLRPAAIHILRNSTTSEEKAILAALNGNLIELKELTPTIKAQVPRILSKMDENLIAANYRKIVVKTSEDYVNKLNLPGNIWPFLAARSMTDWDSWSQYDNLNLKHLLDMGFPVRDFTAESIVKGGQAVGDLSKLRSMIDSSVKEHISKLMDNNPENWCCNSVSGSLVYTDYIDLIEGIATDNLFRRARFFITNQGSPERANTYLETLEGIYKGHPRFALYHGMTKMELSRQKRGAERESLLKQAYLDAFNATFWSNGQTRVAADAFSLRVELGRDDFGYADNPYVTDYPFKPFYPVWQAPGLPERIANNSLRALKNSTYHFQPVRDLASSYSNNQEQLDKVIGSIKNRFSGNAEYVEFMAEISMKRGNTREAESYYREGIALSPEHWDYYSKLGSYLVRNARIDEAFELYKLWPGFEEDSPLHRVARSNSAYEAGSQFFWSGHLEYARLFYRIAAKLDTGSAASMASAIRLHILQGEYDLALQGSLQRARRYNSSYAYRDYFGLLHVTGKSDQAWNGFNVIVNRQNTPHVWETALTGHRLKSVNQSDITAWVKQYKHLVSERGASYAAMYLLRANVVDRVPSEQLVEAIQGIEKPIWKMVGGHKHVYRESADSTNKNVLGPRLSITRGVIPLGSYQKYDRKRVKSALVYFAEAYRAIRLGNFKDAAQLLDEATSLYNTADHEFGHLLPYYAYAASRASDTKGIEKLLKTFDHKKIQSFDYQLARAVLTGLKGDYANSLKHLELAQYRRNHTEDRPLFTEYQYAEVIELLFEATNNPLYKKRLVEWSDKVRQFFPWYSWPYTMLAKYSDNPEQRMMSIAMGYYLDKDSYRLKGISEATIKDARDKFENLNPFNPMNSLGQGQKDSI